MWIVELALRRPYTFVVVSILIAILGVISAFRMPIDIFPVINIPVVSVIWAYTGLPPEEMAERIVTVSERAMTTVTSDIEHMESSSINGVGIIKVYLQQNANVGEAVALMNAVNQTVLRVMPPGITPPLITAFSASDVPVLQMGVTSTTLTEAQLYDYDLNFIRTRLATVGGASIPLPYGGKQRQVMVDLYPNRLLAKNISPDEVVSALSLQNVILPSGDAKIGTRDYPIRLNNSPLKLEEFNDIPIKQVNGATIFIRDIGLAHDGYATQLNVVRMNGHRGTLLNVLRSGGASTLAVVEGIKNALPLLKAGLPKSLDIQIVADQSKFVRGAIDQVVHEAVVAALLTGLLMFALLGSWRSTLIVATSIPLSVLASITVLGAIGQTLNTMTLGGLSLAVGMLVDDATVEVENIHRNLDEGMELRHAVLTSAAQIATPAFVSTFAICIVFIPVALLTEPERSLFVPLGVAVVFAMAASYFLSRTLVPVMAVYLLRAEEKRQEVVQEHLPPPPDESAPYTHMRDRAKRVHAWIDSHFNKARDRYHGVLNSALRHRKLAICCFLAFFVISVLILPLVGMDFFPAVDAGQMRLHIVAPVGSRVEETERWYSLVETAIRKNVIPPEDLAGVTYNIGIPASGINLSYGDAQNYTEFDGEMLITLTPAHHTSTFVYQKRIREMLARDFPNLVFFFQAADITSQILNAGLPAPIDIQITGAGIAHADENYRLAMAIRREVALVPGAVDVLIRQVPNAPQINLDVDRTKAIQLGLTTRDVASSLLTSLVSSFQTSPGFWVNPENGVNYTVAVQTPTYKITTIDDMQRTLITGANGLLVRSSGTGQTTNGLGTYGNSSAIPGVSSLLMNLASARRSTTSAIVSHYRIQPVFDIYASIQDRDLGGVIKDIQRIVEKYRKQLPGGSQITIRGQASSMNVAFGGLLGGMVFALLLVYLLLVVNFQSWVDPAIILMAIPGAFSGIIWMLFLTQTTFSVPALMGSIMSIGVASANSILMVSFGNDQLGAGHHVYDAASQAGFTRFRPVLMTASAMIIGMLPMALGLGEGGGQNAPLGRAVIGGLLVATFTTLLFVPVMFSVIKERTHGEERVAKRIEAEKAERKAEEDAKRAREERRGIDETGDDVGGEGTE